MSVRVYSNAVSLADAKKVSTLDFTSCWYTEMLSWPSRLSFVLVCVSVLVYVSV